MRFVGTYSLSYTYHSRRWFQYGGTVSFGAVTQSRRDNITDEKVEQLNEYMVSVMPTVRFVYLYRENVQLYSSLSLGVVVGTGMGGIWADATLFGCSFGRNLFGFAEIGAGVGGWGRIGLAIVLMHLKNIKRSNPYEKVYNCGDYLAVVF